MGIRGKGKSTRGPGMGSIMTGGRGTFQYGSDARWCGAYGVGYERGLWDYGSLP